MMTPMPPAVSVITVVDEDLSSFRTLLTSLDLQSLPTDQFELVVADGGLPDDVRSVLDTIARCRPNVRTVAGTSGSILGAALDAASGIYVLAVDVTDELRPQALARLHDEAVRTGSEAVVGKRIHPDGDANGWRVLTRDGPVDPDSVSQLSGLPVLVARHAAPAESRSSRDFAARAVENAEAPTVLASYSCIIGDRTEEPAAATSTALSASAPTEATWSDGALTLSVALNAHPGLDADDLMAFVRSRETGEEWPITLSASHADATIDITMTVDPATAAMGEPLAQGRWRVVLRDRAESASSDFPIAAPAERVLPGIVDGRVVIAFRTRSGDLDLDVGGTRRSALTRVDPAHCVIGEDARGTLLTVHIPVGTVRGNASLDGRLRLGSFPIKARIVTDGQEARLESWLTGLAGTSELSTDFGSAKPVPMGLTLEISGTGEMSVRRTPPKTRPVTPTGTASGRTSVTLRSRLAAVPGARAIHGKVLALTRRR